MASGPRLRIFCARLRRVLTHGALVLILLILLAATPPGLWLCAKTTSVLMSAFTPFSIHVTGLSGIFPFTLRAERIEVLDQSGVWLTIRGLALHVRLQDLLKGRARLAYLTSTEVRCDRRPIREKRWRIPQIPGLIHWPSVDTVSIGRLVVGQPVLGRPIAVTVHGLIGRTTSGGAQKIVLAARRIDDKSGTLDIAYEQNGESPSFHAHLDDSDILTHWLGLDSSIVLDLSGSGPRKDWRGTLHGTTASQKVLDGVLRVSGEFPTVITASLDTNIAPSRRLQALESFLGPDTHFSMDALLAQSGQLDFLSLGASSPRGIVRGTGTVLLPEKQFTLAFQGTHSDLALLSCKEEGTDLYVPANISASIWGDASAFQVRVLASANDLPLLQAETTILPGPCVQFDGAATVFSAPLIANSPAVALFGDSAALAWSGHYSAPGLLSLDSFAVDNPALQINAAGSVAFPSASADIQYAGLFHIARIPILAGYSRSDKDIPFAGRLTDDLMSPTMSLEASGVNVDTDGLAIQEGTLDLSFHLAQSGTGKSLRNGWIRIGSRQCGYGDHGGLAASCTAGFESDDLDLFRFQGIHVTVPALAADFAADAVYARAASTADLTGRITIDDLTASSVLYPHTFAGALSGAFHIEKTKDAAPVRLRAEFDWNHPSGLSGALGPAVGDKLHAVLHVESDQEHITLKDARIDIEAGTITASGWQTRMNHKFKLLVNTNALNLAKFGTATPFQQGHESLDLSTRLEGAPDDCSLAVDAHIKDFSWDRLAVRSTKLKITAEHLPASPGGTIFLSATNGKKGLSLEGNLAYHFYDRRVQVENAKFTSGKNHFDGGVDYGFDTGDFSANADFAFPALKDLSTLLGLELSGTAQGKVGASRKGDKLDLTLRGKAEKLEAPWGRIGSLDANGSVVDILRKPQGDATILATAFSRNGIEFSRAEMTLSGDGSSATAKATVAGRYQKGEVAKPLPFTLRTSAKASFQNQDLTLTEATGQLDKMNFSLAGPAHLRRTGANYTLDKVAVRVGEGGGELSLSASASEIHAASSWKDVPLSVAALSNLDYIYGTSSGSLLVGGTLQAPTLNLELQLDKARSTALDHGHGVNASIKAVHDGQWTTLEMESTLSDAAKTTLSARIPLTFSLSPLQFVLREHDALQANADISADLPAVAVLMDWTNDLPRGSVAGKVRLVGTVAAPKVSGELSLDDGGYENLRYGAIIKSLRVRLVADGNTVRIAEFSGTDGENGKLSATGQMEVSFEKGHPFLANVTLDRMRSLRTEYGTAFLTGKIQFAGSMADAKLSGDITVQEGDFRLPDHPSASRTPKVEFTEKNAPEKIPVPPAVAAPVFPAMALDLSVSIPGRVFLRAPVLETEWNGDIHLRGTLREPRAEGTLRVTRGYLDLIGQRFSLADSTVGFSQGDIRTPYLNMTGVCMATDITARIQVSGSPTDAQLALSSDPPLPQDEVLSKLLFRKGVSQASPLQAIQLARTAAMFSDRLSLPQFLTGSVTLPGLDLFDIRTGEKVDKTVVGVGKYINDKIYVEAEQGASTDSGRVSAQVEVTPRVSVKADVGAKNRGGVGIMWKKDY